MQSPTKIARLRCALVALTLAATTAVAVAQTNFPRPPRPDFGFPSTSNQPPRIPTPPRPTAPTTPSIPASPFTQSRPAGSTSPFNATPATESENPDDATESTPESDAEEKSLATSAREDMERMKEQLRQKDGVLQPTSPRELEERFKKPEPTRYNRKRYYVSRLVRTILILIGVIAVWSVDSSRRNAKRIRQSEREIKQAEREWNRRR